MEHLMGFLWHGGIWLAMTTVLGPILAIGSIPITILVNRCRINTLNNILTFFLRVLCFYLMSAPIAVWAYSLKPKVSSNEFIVIMFLGLLLICSSLLATMWDSSKAASVMRMGSPSMEDSSLYFITRWDPVLAVFVAVSFLIACNVPEVAVPEVAFQAWALENWILQIPFLGAIAKGAGVLVVIGNLWTTILLLMALPSLIKKEQNPSTMAAKPFSHNQTEQQTNGGHLWIKEMIQNNTPERILALHDKAKGMGENANPELVTEFIDSESPVFKLEHRRKLMTSIVDSNHRRLLQLLREMTLKTMLDLKSAGKTEEEMALVHRIQKCPKLVETVECMWLHILLEHFYFGEFDGCVMEKAKREGFLFALNNSLAPFEELHLYEVIRPDAIALGSSDLLINLFHYPAYFLQTELPDSAALLGSILDPIVEGTFNEFRPQLGDRRVKDEWIDPSVSPGRKAL